MIHLLFSRISVFILKGPELRDSQEKNNEKAKGQQCMSKGEKYRTICKPSSSI